MPKENDREAHANQPGGDEYPLPSATLQIDVKQNAITAHNEDRPEPPRILLSPSTAESNPPSPNSVKENELKKLFVHLNKITVIEQKSLASAFNVIQKGNKKLRATRLFVTLSGIMQRTNRSAKYVLAKRALERGKDFTTEYERTIRTWSVQDQNEVVPPIEELQAQAGVRESGTGEDGSSEVTNSRGKKRLSDDITQEYPDKQVHHFKNNKESDCTCKKKKTELEELQLKLAKRENESQLVRQLVEAHEHRTKMNQTADRRFRNIIEKHYLRLIEEAEKRIQ